MREEKITLPDKLGMIWNASEGPFLAALDDCREYYAKHGNLQIPLNMVGKSGVRLNYWISDRCAITLSKQSFDKYWLVESVSARVGKIILVVRVHDQVDSINWIGEEAVNVCK